ncbi:hypothetical protein MRX96_009637 [Rhipicephalus microplus]
MSGLGSTFFGRTLMHFCFFVQISLLRAGPPWDLQILPHRKTVPSRMRRDKATMEHHHGKLRFTCCVDAMTFAV